MVTDCVLVASISTALNCLNSSKLPLKYIERMVTLRRMVRLTHLITP